MKFNKLSKDDIKKVVKEEQKTEKKKFNSKIIVRTIEVMFAVAYLVILGFGRFFLPADYELYKSFDIISKENPIPLIRTLSYIIFVIIAGNILRLVIKGLSKSKTLTKKFSLALMQLFSNLVKYVMYITVACLILGALGVDTAAILGGLGIFALVIGLGVTSLIEDIVAGIFIIIERTFDVGDIIVVDGFRGTVVSIGIRSTKIADVGGDIRTMRNSSIGAVINLTDRQSCVAITIPIAPEESLENVEKIIKNGNIEKIKDNCPLMIGEPIYLGLCEITPKGVQNLLFIAGCKEADRYDVERALYHGLKLMFDSNDVKLGYTSTMNNDEE